MKLSRLLLAAVLAVLILPVALGAQQPWAVHAASELVESKAAGLEEVYVPASLSDVPEPQDDHVRWTWWSWSDETGSDWPDDDALYRASNRNLSLEANEGQSTTEQHALPAVPMVTVTGEVRVVSAEDRARMVAFDLEVTPLQNLSNHTILYVVLTEDRVHKPGVEGYGQTNAYNYCNGDAPDVPMATPTVNFNAFCGPIVPSSFMHFRHVARAIVPSYEGDTESLPSSVEADGQYTYTFPTQTIPDDFDETKMRAIALLIDGTTGEVVNCLGADFNEPQTSAVGPLAFANVPAKLFPNPAAQTTVLEFNCHRAQLASLDILDALGKVVTQRTIALNPGTNKIDLDVSSLEQGTYMVQVQGDAELHISERLLVSER